MFRGSIFKGKSLVPILNLLVWWFVAMNCLGGFWTARRDPNFYFGVVLRELECFTFGRECVLSILAIQGVEFSGSAGRSAGRSAFCEKVVCLSSGSKSHSFSMFSEGEWCSFSGKQGLIVGNCKEIVVLFGICFLNYSILYNWCSQYEKEQTPLLCGCCCNRSAKHLPCSAKQQQTLQLLLLRPFPILVLSARKVLLHWGTASMAIFKLEKTIRKPEKNRSISHLIYLSHDCYQAEPSWSSTAKRSISDTPISISDTTWHAVKFQQVLKSKWYVFMPDIDPQDLSLKRTDMHCS